jgi:hypothetical protein
MIADIDRAWDRVCLFLRATSIFCMSFSAKGSAQRSRPGQNSIRNIPHINRTVKAEINCTGPIARAFINSFLMIQHTLTMSWEGLTVHFNSMWIYTDSSLMCNIYIQTRV